MQTRAKTMDLAAKTKAGEGCSASDSAVNESMDSSKSNSNQAVKDKWKVKSNVSRSRPRVGKNNPSVPCEMNVNINIHQQEYSCRCHSCVPIVIDLAKLVDRTVSKYNKYEDKQSKTLKKDSEIFSHVGSCCAKESGVIKVKSPNNGYISFIPLLTSSATKQQVTPQRIKRERLENNLRSSPELDGSNDELDSIGDEDEEAVHGQSSSTKTNYNRKGQDESFTKEHTEKERAYVYKGILVNGGYNPADFAREPYVKLTKMTNYQIRQYSALIGQYCSSCETIPLIHMDEKGMLQEDDCLEKGCSSDTKPYNLSSSQNSSCSEICKNDVVHRSELIKELEYVNNVLSEAGKMEKKEKGQTDVEGFSSASEDENCTSTGWVDIGAALDSLNIVVNDTTSVNRHPDDASEGQNSITRERTDLHNSFRERPKTTNFKELAGISAFDGKSRGEREVESSNDEASDVCTAGSPDYSLKIDDSLLLPSETVDKEKDGNFTDDNEAENSDKDSISRSEICVSFSAHGSFIGEGDTETDEPGRTRVSLTVVVGQDKHKFLSQQFPKALRSENLDSSPRGNCQKKKRSPQKEQLKSLGKDDPSAVNNYDVRIENTSRSGESKNGGNDGISCREDCSGKLPDMGRSTLSTSAEQNRDLQPEQLKAKGQSCSAVLHGTGSVCDSSVTVEQLNKVKNRDEYGNTSDSKHPESNSNNSDVESCAVRNESRSSNDTDSDGVSPSRKKRSALTFLVRQYDEYMTKKRKDRKESDSFSVTNDLPAHEERESSCESRNEQSGKGDVSPVNIDSGSKENSICSNFNDFVEETYVNKSLGMETTLSSVAEEGRVDKKKSKHGRKSLLKRMMKVKEWKSAIRKASATSELQLIQLECIWKELKSRNMEIPVAARPKRASQKKRLESETAKDEELESADLSSNFSSAAKKKRARNKSQVEEETVKEKESSPVDGKVDSPHKKQKNLSPKKPGREEKIEEQEEFEAAECNPKPKKSKSPKKSPREKEKILDRDTSKSSDNIEDCSPTFRKSKSPGVLNVEETTGQEQDKSEFEICKAEYSPKKHNSSKSLKSIERENQMSECCESTLGDKKSENSPKFQKSSKKRSREDKVEDEEEEKNESRIEERGDSSLILKKHTSPKKLLKEEELNKEEIENVVGSPSKVKMSTLAEVLEMEEKTGNDEESLTVDAKAGSPHKIQRNKSPKKHSWEEKITEEEESGLREAEDRSLKNEPQKNSSSRKRHISDEESESETDETGDSSLIGKKQKSPKEPVKKKKKGVVHMEHESMDVENEEKSCPNGKKITSLEELTELHDYLQRKDWEAIENLGYSGDGKQHGKHKKKLSCLTEIESLQGLKNSEDDKTKSKKRKKNKSNEEVLMTDNVINGEVQPNVPELSEDFLQFVGETKSKVKVNRPESNNIEKKKMKRHGGKEKHRKDKKSSGEDYIPLNVSGPTRFRLVELEKFKKSPLRHPAADLKNELLYGSRIKRVPYSSVQSYKMKLESRNFRY